MAAPDTTLTRPTRAATGSGVERRVRFDETVFEAMGTTVHVIVSIRQDAGATSEGLLAVARAEVEATEQRLSRFLEGSEVSLINSQAGRPVRVSRPTLDLVATAVRASEATEGAFDPLLGLAIERAGYDRDFARLRVRPEGREHRVATDEVLDAIGSSNRIPGQRHPRIRIDAVASTIEVAPGGALDLGGIAKGATADAVSARLMELGALGCCVSIGGDLRVRGIGPDEGAWRVELACPGARTTEPKRTIRLRDGAVCTSSTSKRRWQLRNGGPAKHHLLDPSTGESRENGPTTVTIIAASATAAEIVTKWVFAGGSPGVFETTGVVVERSGVVTEFPGFAAFAADEKSVCASTPPRAATAESLSTS